MELFTEQNLYTDLILPRIRVMESEIGLEDGDLSRSVGHLNQIVLNRLMAPEARTLNEMFYSKSIVLPSGESFALAEIDLIQEETGLYIPVDVYECLVSLKATLNEMVSSGFLYESDEVDLSARAPDLMRDWYFQGSSEAPMKFIKNLFNKNRLTPKFKNQIFQLSSLGVSEEEKLRHFEDFIFADLKRFLGSLPRAKKWDWINFKALTQGMFDEKLMEIYLR